jgi:hypothetical protein
MARKWPENGPKVGLKSSPKIGFKTSPQISLKFSSKILPESTLKSAQNQTEMT